MTILRNFFIFLLLLTVISAVVLISYNIAFNTLIFPKTSISGISMSGMNRETALALLEKYFEMNPNSIALRGGKSDNLRLNTFKTERDFIWAVDQAVGVGRSGNILTRIKEQLSSLKNGREILIPIKYDSDELEGILDQIEEEINTDPVWPALEIKGGDVLLTKGKNGMIVDRDELKNEIIRLLSLPDSHLLDIPMQVVMTEENEDQAILARESAKKWLGKKLTLKARGKEVVLQTDQILALYGLSMDKVNETGYEKLITEISPALETEAKNAIFVFENNRVEEFEPEVVGVKIDKPKLKDLLGSALYNSDNEELEVSLILTNPDITTGDINDLGIKELVGRGTSEFAHSIPGRVFNVNLASKRINGVLIAPGDEFSFNSAVGEISRSTGYQSAYIISGGKTILGDGGGVCQVSTTVFRAALNAGLPITERKAHAYRVGYYEQDSKPGIDATVYGPSVDLKFKNDTGHHLLVQTYVDTKNMKMRVDIFGTKDGRVAKITEPKLSSQSAPPATLFVDDPTLAKGVKKQIDWSAWGAKVSFDYMVEKDGQTILEKTFYSNYQPWQAVYLVGTKE